MEIKIGNVIRQLRKANEMSQETLAEKMNVTVQAVSKWENGLSIPDVSLIPEIAEHFGVTVRIRKALIQVSQTTEIYTSFRL